MTTKRTSIKKTFSDYGEGLMEDKAGHFQDGHFALYLELPFGVYMSGV